MQMTYEQDYDVKDSGAGFLLGLLSGAVLGVGIGMLLAPRSGAELRHGLAQSANDLQRAATDSLNQVSSKVRETAEKGRGAISRAKDSWDQTRQEAEVAVTAATSGAGPYAG
jgi:gas vesicle protein